MERRWLYAGGASRDRMPISALDAYENQAAVAYVAFFRRTLDADLLVRGLEAVLPDLPLLTGRLVRGAITLGDAGLPFEIAETHETLGDWARPDRSAIGRFARKMFPQSPLRWREPLAGVRLTQLRGGGSVLAITLSHVLADGLAITGLLHRWAAAVRGEPLPEPPLWDRRALAAAVGAETFDDRAVPVRERTYLGMHEASVTELARLYAHLLRQLPRWKGYAFRLSGERIERLKVEAGADGPRGASSNDALSAYLWKLFAIARAGTGAHRSRFFGVVDLRRHTRGVPARGVFGCMSGHVRIDTTTDALARMELGAIARRLREASAAIGPDTYLAQDAWLARRRRTGRMGRVIAGEPWPGDVCVSNCRYLPFYETDFGGGRPYCFDLPVESFPRLVLWPAPDGDGCMLDVNLTPEMARTILPALELAQPR